MSGLDQETVSRELRHFLMSEVLAAGVQLEDDSVLADVGVDSFALMEVVLFVERKYGVVVPMEQLTPDGIRTLRGLSGSLLGIVSRA